MGEKRATIFIAFGMVIMLCLSLFIVMHKNSDEVNNTIINITESSESTLADAEKEQLSESLSSISENATVIQSENNKSEISENNCDSVLHININTADSTELQQLKGIGEIIAGRIVEYRNTNGSYQNIEEIMNVSGIGEKTFADIYEYIYVDNPVYTQEIPAETVDTTENEKYYATEKIIIEETTMQETQTEEMQSTIGTTNEMTLEEAAPININEADVEELMLLPYVTEEIANEILNLRKEIGRFSNTYELLYIEELTQKEVAEIIKFVTVGQLT